MERDMKACSPVDEIYSTNYKMVMTLGRGHFAEVKLACHIPTVNCVAVKILRKNKENASFMAKTRDSTYMVMELASEGELRMHILEWGSLPDQETQRWFSQILCAVQYCHSNSIVHRDIKAENILVDGRGNAKLSNLGLAVKVQPGERIVDFHGTLPYCAPKLFGTEPYDGYPIGSWSLGVLLFIMVSGDFPFGASPPAEVRRQVLAANISIPSYISLDIFTVIIELLIIHPGRRPTADQIMEGWRTSEPVFPTFDFPPEPQEEEEEEEKISKQGGRRHSMPAILCCQPKKTRPQHLSNQGSDVDDSLLSSNLDISEKLTYSKMGLYGSLAVDSQPSSPLRPHQGVTANHTDEGTSCCLSSLETNISWDVSQGVTPRGSFIGDMSSEVNSTAGQPQSATTSFPRSCCLGWKGVKKTMMNCLRCLCCCLPPEGDAPPLVTTRLQGTMGSATEAGTSESLDSGSRGFHLCSQDERMFRHAVLTSALSDLCATV
ncbi:sperm motility kinase-like [Nannospalax galili]|uniref:sperm motility kinase-like n=1 Tax=Nannospalax galili TaxID=1026970 RepID=UPI0004ED0652|nr:sperm motility kinase-like [Nannospalax galili]